MPTPGPGEHLLGGRADVDLEAAGRAEVVVAPPGVEVQGRADLPWPGEQHRPLLAAAARTDGVEAMDGLGGADEDGGAVALLVGDQVEELVQAVAGVDVGVAGGPEHGGVAGGGAGAGVAGAVVGPGVRLRLGDVQHHVVPHQVASQQVAGDDQRGAREEGARESAHSLSEPGRSFSRRSR